MMVIADSNIWSEAFRKTRGNRKYSVELGHLITEGMIVMLGPIRQEVLSGIKSQEKYEQVKRALRAFPSARIDETDFENAASYFNLCRGHGIQGSHIDYLICACAIRLKTHIFTQDKDFTRYSKYIPIRLHEVK